MGFSFLYNRSNKMHIKITDESEDMTTLDENANMNSEVEEDDAILPTTIDIGDYVKLSNKQPTLSQRFSSLQTFQPIQTNLRQKPELFCVNRLPTDIETTVCPNVEVSQFINVPQTNGISLQFVVLEILANNVVTAFCTSNGYTYEIDTAKHVVEPLTEKYTIQSHAVRRMCMIELQRIRNIPENTTTEETRKEIAENDEKFRKLILLYKRMYVGEELIYSLKLSHLAIILEGHRKSYLAELIEQLERDLDI